MPSPSVTVLDPTSDVTREELARLVKVYNFPAFVKQADLDETMNPTNAAISTYADPRQRRYPCHSAAATWLSALYFHEKQAEYHPKDQARIRQRLESYVDYFRIGGAYQEMSKQAADLRAEPQLPDSAYAYVWASQDGHKQRYLPMRSAMEVKAAADWLETYQGSLPFRDRHVIANKVLDKAAYFGAGIRNQEFLEKQAGMGVCDPQEVYAMIMQRAKLAKGQSFQEKIAALATTVKNKPRQALTPDSLVKLAETIDQIDQQLGLHGRYTELIRRPEDVIFKVTYTKAAADRVELCALTTGNVYGKSQFEKLSYDDLEALFGTEFAREVSDGIRVNPEKLAEIAHTLPRPDAMLLDRLMAESGLVPEMAKTAHDQGLSNDELQALAKVYEQQLTGTV